MTEFPVTVVDAGPMVRATLLLPGCPPERALAAFTDPATLRQWWGGELTFAPAEGGPYIVHFAKLGRTMRERVTGQRDSAPAGRDRSFAPPMSAFWPSR